MRSTSSGAFRDAISARLQTPTAPPPKRRLLRKTNMKFIYALIAATTLISACAPGAAIDSDMERGLVGAALGYGAAKAVNGNGDRGAIIGGLAGVFCDDAGVCSRPRY